MKSRVLLLSLLLVFFADAVSLCPCTVQASSSSKTHDCCTTSGKCPQKDCQNPQMVSFLSISEIASYNVFPNPPIVIKTVPFVLKRLELVKIPFDLIPQLSLPDIPIAYSTLLI